VSVEVNQTGPNNIRDGTLDSNVPTASAKDDLSWIKASLSGDTLDVDTAGEVKVTTSTSTIEEIYVDGVFIFPSGPDGVDDSLLTFTDSDPTSPEEFASAVTTQTDTFPTAGDTSQATITVDSVVDQLALSNLTSGFNSASSTDSFDATFAQRNNRVEAEIRLAPDAGGGDADRITSVDIDADIVIRPRLFNRFFRGDEIEQVLSRLAEDGDYLWEVQRTGPQRDDMKILFRQTGAVTRAADFAEIAVNARKETEQAYDAVIVEGSAQSREETVDLSGSSPQSQVDLAEDNLVSGSETLTDANGEELERRIDYLVDYQEGKVSTPSGVSVDNPVEVRYQHKPRGQVPIPANVGANDKILRQTSASADTDDDCLQLAAVLRDIVSEPIEEAQITVSEIDPGVEITAAIDSDDIPFDAKLEIYNLSVILGVGIRLDVGERQRVDVALERLDKRLGAVSEQI
jgi:hypothetical protein